MFYPRFELSRANDSLRAFSNLNRLFAQAQELFDFSETETNDTSVTLEENGATIRLAIPGYSDDQLSIEVERDSVLIRAAERTIKPDGEAASEGRYLRREIAHGSLSRRVKLPFLIDNDATTARYEQGVLSIAVAKHRSEQARSIAITAA